MDKINGEVKGVLSKPSAVSGSVTQGSGGGTRDYDKLTNKPSIEGVELQGNKTFRQLGMEDITPQDIDAIFDEMIYGG